MDRKPILGLLFSGQTSQDQAVPQTEANPEKSTSIKSSLTLVSFGFSLIELLAVVGIMALLIVVGIPALKGLTGSGGRKQALSQLMGALDVARNTAISIGTNAAVIFPDSTFAGGEAYKYRSMAVVAWNPTNTTTPPTMAGPWIVLPQGIAFFPISLAKLPTNQASYRLLTSTKTANFPAVIFQSDGSLCEDFTPLPTNGIAFFEGTVVG
ncbi:MAG: hypothetical protein EBS53_13295, partial [Bacteroidetes bacterium]|nr:hypothetical protein [Bacteroidota bacterium]